MTSSGRDSGWSIGLKSLFTCIFFARSFERLWDIESKTYSGRPFLENFYFGGNIYRKPILISSQGPTETARNWKKVIFPQLEATIDDDGWERVKSHAQEKKKKLTIESGLLAFVIDIRSERESIDPVISFFFQTSFLCVLNTNNIYAWMWEIAFIARFLCFHPARLGVDWCALAFWLLFLGGFERSQSFVGRISSPDPSLSPCPHISGIRKRDRLKVK